MSKFLTNKAQGKIMGVCAGLADYSGVDVLWWRLGLVILTLTTGGLVLLAYIALGIFCDDKGTFGGMK